MTGIHGQRGGCDVQVSLLRARAPETERLRRMPNSGDEVYGRVLAGLDPNSEIV